MIPSNFSTIDMNDSEKSDSKIKDETAPLIESKKTVFVSLEPTIHNFESNKSDYDDACIKQRKKNTDSLLSFINHGPYNYENFEINKVEILKNALTHKLNSLDAEPISYYDIVKEALTSPQANLIIIIFILIDWCFAAVKIFTNFADPTNNLCKIIDKIILTACLVFASIFLLEICLKIIFAPEYFFGSKLEILDGFIVFFSFALEITLAVKKQEYEFLRLFLTIFRFLRILRIINSKFDYNFENFGLKNITNFFLEIPLYYCEEYHGVDLLHLDLSDVFFNCKDRFK
jgi:hypothetical protein